MATQADKHVEAPATGELPFPPPPIPSDALEHYREFWRLWREEKFFACHEVLEELWRVTPGEQRLFYNGLIHCAVAIYQHRRSNAVGAARQLLRAQVKLQRFRPSYYQVDVEGLLSGVERAVASSLSTLSDGQQAQLRELRLALEERIERQFPSKNEGI